MKAKHYRVTDVNGNVIFNVCTATVAARLVQHRQGIIVKHAASGEAIDGYYYVKELTEPLAEIYDLKLIHTMLKAGCTRSEIADALKTPVDMLGHFLNHYGLSVEKAMKTDSFERNDMDSRSVHMGSWDRVCCVCGKKFVVYLNNDWVYRRGNKYMCSWTCLRAYDKKHPTKGYKVL